MNTQQTSFQTVLDSLLDPNHDFPRRYLPLFSDIGNPELKNVQEIWHRVDQSRKLTLLDGLKTLADNDTLVNFDEFARPLLNDPEASVRVHALRLLMESDDVKLFPIYLDLLKNDVDANVRA